MAFERTPHRNTVSTFIRGISLPVELLFRVEALRVLYPTLNFSKIARIGITRILDEIDNDSSVARQYCDRKNL